MKLEDLLLIATRAGLQLKSVEHKIVDSSNREKWGFKFADQPYFPVWDVEPEYALSQLMQRVLRDRMRLMDKFVGVSDPHPRSNYTRFKKQRRRAESLLDELEALL